MSGIRARLLGQTRAPSAWSVRLATAPRAVFHVSTISGRSAVPLGRFSHGGTRRVSDFTKTVNNPVKLGALGETRRGFPGQVYKSIVWLRRHRLYSSGPVCQRTGLHPLHGARRPFRVGLVHVYHHCALEMVAPASRER